MKYLIVTVVAFMGGNISGQLGVNVAQSLMIGSLVGLAALLICDRGWLQGE